MIHGKRFVFRQNRTTFERFGDLGHGHNAVVKQREENGTTLSEETCRGVWRVVEARPGNQGHDTRQNLFDQERALLAPEDLVLSSRA